MQNPFSLEIRQSSQAILKPKRQARLIDSGTFGPKYRSKSKLIYPEFKPSRKGQYGGMYNRFKGKDLHRYWHI